MRAMVTGSAGFIGSRLTSELRRRGHRVYGVDRRYERAGDHWSWDLADPRWAGRLADLAADVDIVFHLAARPGVRDSQPGVEELRRRDNVEATRALLAAVPLATPIVATSSSSVYGGARGSGGAIRASRETDPLRPRGGYARSKAEMERLCELRRQAGGIVTVLRPFTVAGEGQRPDMAFALWADALREGRPIRLLGSPGRSRDITDVTDVVEGLIRAGEAGYNGALNLGTGVAHRLIDMAAALLDAAGVPAEVIVETAGPEDVAATLADTDLCRSVLRFVPRTDLPGVARRVWATVARPATATNGSAAG